MESNGIPGGMFPGMLGLEMSLHHHPQPPLQNPQNPNNNNNHLQENQPMVAFGAHEQTPKQQGNVNPFAQKARTQHLLTFSDENDDEPEPAGPTADDRKSSPWHRMKWSDEMVRLLITVVFYVGDDAVGSEGNDPHAAAVARKKAAGVVLQKKGKWKSVSAAMMEKGYYVSPQQCEDKFNDLNKRYKRVNEILGRGTACKVVENQSLLEGMGHLSSKMKEEVKKLLNSKHLYFREMCAFHNTYGGGGGQPVSAEAAAESSQPSRQKKGCLHLPESTSNYVTNLSRTETNGSKMVLEGSDEEDDDDDEEVVEGGAHDIHEYDTDDKTTRKKARKETYDLESPLVEEFSTELKNVVEDETKSVWEKRQWMRMRLIQLEEQRLKYQRQSFELEKERMKWLKFSSNKEKEMEVEKLGNKRMKLENERMLLFLRRKEQELHDLQ